MLNRSNLDDFRFKNRNIHNVKNAIKDLMKPIRFGQDIAKWLKGKSNDGGLKSMLNFNGGSYRKICLNLETLVSDFMRQRDM